MKLVPAICPNCGASLKINGGEKAAVCDYCNTAFIVEEAINKYNTFQTTNVQHLHADQVILNDSGVDKLLNAGHSLIRLQKFKDADEQFTNACRQYPGDWRSWWGRVEVMDAGRQKNADYIASFGENKAEKIIGECCKNVQSLNGGQMPAETQQVYQRITAYMKKYREIADQREREKKQIEEKHGQIRAQLEEQFEKGTAQLCSRIEQLGKEESAFWKEKKRLLDKNDRTSDLVVRLKLASPAVAFVLVCVLLDVANLTGEKALILAGLAAGAAALGFIILPGILYNWKLFVSSRGGKRTQAERMALVSRFESAKQQCYEAEKADKEVCRKEISEIEKKYRDRYDAWKKTY